MRKDNLYPTDQLFRDFKVLSIKQIYLKTIIQHFLKSEIITREPGNMRTRSVDMGLAVVPRMRTAAGQRSAYYIAPAFYNSIPPALKNHTYKAGFSSKLLDYFQSNEGSELVRRLLN